MIRTLFPQHYFSKSLINLLTIASFPIGPNLRSFGRNVLVKIKIVKIIKLTSIISHQRYGNERNSKVVRFLQCLALQERSIDSKLQHSKQLIDFDVLENKRFSYLKIMF